MKQIEAKPLSNSYREFRLLNLSVVERHPEQRGPFMVLQEAVDPGDEQQRVFTFALTRRGGWLHYHIVTRLPEEVIRAHVHFETAHEVISLAETLTASIRLETVDDLVAEYGSADGVRVAMDRVDESASGWPAL